MSRVAEDWEGKEVDRLLHSTRFATGLGIDQTTTTRE